jgi:AraC-like DNA-binding protein
MGHRRLPIRAIALHMALPALFFLYVLITGNNGEQLYYVPFGQGGTETSLIRWAVILSSLIYLLAGFLSLMRKYRRLPHFFSSPRQTEPLWLFSCVGGLALSWLAFVGIWLLGRFIPFLQGQALDYSIVMFCIVIFFLGLFGIRHTPIFSDETEDEASESKGETVLAKENVISKEDEEHYRDQLETFMQKQKPYLNGKLTIRGLSRQSGIAMPVLSQLLNRGEGQNFFTFVNHYRVEEFKKRMADPAYKNYTLTAIAFECGFNSKSSFYSVFKKMTGQTPSEYSRSGSA